MTPAERSADWYARNKEAILARLRVRRALRAMQPALLIPTRHHPLDRVVPGEEELGVQRQCNKCGADWPLDEEFFSRGERGLRGRCRACEAEARAGRPDLRPNHQRRAAA